MRLPGCSPPGGKAMRLTYAVEVSPRPYLPVGLVEGRIARDLCSNLKTIRDIFAATLSPGCVTFEGGKSMFLSREGSDRGGASEGGDVDLERWANVAGPMILGMNRRNNGCR